MEINIRSHMSLRRQTKVTTFGYRAVLFFFLSFIIFGVVAKHYLVSYHPEASVVDSVPKSVNAHSHRRRCNAIITLFRLLSCHIALAIYSCQCFYILINGLVSLLSQEKYNSLLPEVNIEVITLVRPLDGKKAFFPSNQIKGFTETENNISRNKIEKKRGVSRETFLTSWLWVFYFFCNQALLFHSVDLAGLPFSVPQP